MAVVIVTGCSSGIGLQTALAFARRGDHVYATVRNPGRGAALREALADESSAATIVPLEVTDGDAVLAVFADVLAEHGRLDVLVNNAGIGGPAAALEEIDEAVARAIWETNFWAPFRLCRAALPHMRAQGAGVIVNVSTYGTRFPGGPGLATYAMSKAATSRLTESLQAELAGTGVRVVAIEPGFFATEIYAAEKRPTIDDSSAYAAMVRDTDEHVAAGIAGGADPAIVAAAIITAVDDPASPTRVLVGEDAISAYDTYRVEQLRAWQSKLGAD